MIVNTTIKFKTIKKNTERLLINRCSVSGERNWLSHFCFFGDFLNSGRSFK
jgi:hypothetical protein